MCTLVSHLLALDADFLGSSEFVALPPICIHTDINVNLYLDRSVHSCLNVHFFVDVRLWGGHDQEAP